MHRSVIELALATPAPAPERSVSFSCAGRRCMARQEAGAARRARVRIDAFSVAGLEFRRTRDARFVGARVDSDRQRSNLGDDVILAFGGTEHGAEVVPGRK